MAVKNTTTARNGRRVALTRDGGKAKPGRNSRKEVKVRRSIHIPWSGIGHFFSIIFFLSILLFSIAGVGLGLVYGYKSLVSGEYFALKTLEIQGNSRLTSREILETADLVDGANTLALSIDAVEEALSRHPWVEEVSVKRVLPGTVIIGIREKSPAFWVLHEGALYYADDKGGLIAPVMPGKFASLPALEVEPGAEDAAAALPDLVKSLQESRLPLSLASVSLVRLSAARGVEVYVENAGYKISIGLEEWLPNLQRLGRTLADLTRRGEIGLIREIRAQGNNVWVERRAPIEVAG